MRAKVFGVNDFEEGLMWKSVKQIESHEQAAIARIFSAAVFHQLVKTGHSPMMARLIKELNLDTKHCNLSVGEFLDKAFSLLKKTAFRNEYIYKAAVTQKVLLGAHSLKTAALLHEFRIGNNKADLVMLNGTSIAYEIKSERDRLDRLPIQVASYGEVFAEVTVLCAEKHLKTVKSCIPDFVGISVLTERYQISKIRKGINDPERTKSVSILNSITQKEAIEILTRMEIEVPKLPNTMIYSALVEKFKNIPSTSVHDEMLKVLKSTRNLASQADSIKTIPASLRFFGLTTPYKEHGQKNLMNAIKTPITEALNWG